MRPIVDARWLWSMYVHVAVVLFSYRRGPERLFSAVYRGKHHRTYVKLFTNTAGACVQWRFSLSPRTAGGTVRVNKLDVEVG